MKIIIATVVFLASVSTGVFGQIQFSAGGGVFFNDNSNNAVEGSCPPIRVLNEFSTTTYGIYGFFDATYIEASIAVGFGSYYYNYASFDSDIGGVYHADSEKADASIIDIALLGKYPFKLGPITVFPLAGFSYSMVISVDPYDGGEPSDLNQFGVLFGGGLDYDLTDRLFIRASFLFQIRFASKYQDDEASAQRRDLGADTDTIWGRGPVIKIGVGYKF